MATFLQTTSGDLDLSANNLTVVTDPGIETAQKLRNLFLSVQGEWFLDTSLGIPYFQYIWGVKNPNLGVVGQIFKRTIQAAPYVANISSFTLNLDAKRQLHFYFSAVLTNGQVVEGGTGVPFRVKVTQ